MPIRHPNDIIPTPENSTLYREIKYHDFSILFLFSFLFRRSTRFLCIVSASFSYRAFSSLAARLSFIACILLYEAHY
jgi:hypothetical protein